jgi:type IV secretion system protein VirB9
MKFRALLLGTSLLCGPLPAFAVVDPPAASQEDGRIRSLVYDPNNVVSIYTAPGASLRLELGPDEEVVEIIVSDQDTLAPDPLAPPPATTVSTNPLGGPANQAVPSCDANMCRSVNGNIVYIKPIRALDPQPLFIQTRRTDANGKVQMVPYTFELLTRPTDPKAPPPVWGVRFTYPERVKAAAAARWMVQKRAADAAAKEAASLAHPITAVPGPNDNVRYGFRGAPAVQPDQVWDDGRTTFLRYNGNRRLPNLYSQLPDGHESIPASAPEPDEAGNTLRVARTGSKWWLRDGDEAGCLFDLGPDPDGRTTATVTSAPTKVGK